MARELLSSPKALHISANTGSVRFLLFVLNISKPNIVLICAPTCDIQQKFPIFFRCIVLHLKTPNTDGYVIKYSVITVALRITEYAVWCLTVCSVTY